MKFHNLTKSGANSIVSIVVITYNSSKYVIETLESAKSQSYKNIELIISDDGSTDDTTEICHKWLEINDDYFINTKLIEVSKNTGIPSNVNRGVKEAKGEWIKLIAGDDMLLPNCIKDYIHFVTFNDSDFVFGLPSIISENRMSGHNEKWEKKYLDNDWFFELEAKQQFLYLLIRNFPVNPPTLFFKKDTLVQLKYCDEEYLCEDLPLYLKATYNGYKLDLLKSKTIIYRMQNNSASLNLTNWHVHIGKIINKYFSWALFKSHPFFVWEAYNLNLYYKANLFFNNNYYKKNILISFRLLSPIYILNKLNLLK